MSRNKDLSRTIRVISCHDWQPDWSWLEREYSGSPPVNFRSISTRRPLLGQPPPLRLGRIAVGLEVAAIIARGKADLVVSHGPYTSYYVERLGRSLSRAVPHFAFAFNFTELPRGYRLKDMRRAFARTNRFFVYSRMERELYAATFEIPLERLVFMRWGVAPPIATPQPRTIAERYVVALGGEARDYATLCAAARRLPNVRFVLVVRPHSLDSIDVPPNVVVRTNVPWNEAWSLVWYSEVAVIPLRSDRTPNGHVTLVGGMHLGKAQVITDSAGIRDYAQDEKTALLVPPRDAAAFAATVERLLDDRALRERLGRNAQAFAAEHCSEAVTVATFRKELIESFAAER